MESRYSCPTDKNEWLLHITVPKKNHAHWVVNVIKDVTGMKDSTNSCWIPLVQVLARQNSTEMCAKKTEDAFTISKAVRQKHVCMLQYK